jgi:hypothetical protein
MTLEQKRNDVIARNWLNNWKLNEKDQKVIDEYLQTLRDKKTQG